MKTLGMVGLRMGTKCDNESQVSVVTVLMRQDPDDGKRKRSRASLLDRSGTSEYCEERKALGNKSHELLL